MKTDDFASCSLDALATVTGGADPQHWNLNSIPAKDWKPSGTIWKRNQLFQWGRPDHTTPLPTPYIDGRPPFIHIH